MAPAPELAGIHGRIRACLRDLLPEVWPGPRPRDDDCPPTPATTKFPIKVERTLSNESFNRTRSESRSARRGNPIGEWSFFDLDAGRLTTRYVLHHERSLISAEICFRTR